MRIFLLSKLKEPGGWVTVEGNEKEKGKQKTETIPEEAKLSR